MADDKLSKTVTQVMRDLRGWREEPVPTGMPEIGRQVERLAKREAEKTIREAGYKSVDEFLELVADRATYKFVYFSDLGRLL